MNRLVSKMGKPLLPAKHKKSLQEITLLALSLFLLGSLIPLPEAELPSGNIMGALGEYTKTLMMNVFGISSVFLSALLLTLALRVKGRIKKSKKRKWVHLWIGLLLLGPVMLKTTNLEVGLAVEWGQWGEWAGSFLTTYLGYFAPVVMLLLLVTFFVYTIEWNPLQDIGSVFSLIAGVVGKLISLLSSTKLLLKRKSGGGLEDTVPLELLDSHIEEEDDWIDDVAETSESENEQRDELEESEPLDREDTETSDDKGDQTVMKLGEGDRPPTKTLERSDTENRGEMVAALKEKGDTLIEKLASFDIDGELKRMTIGPVVTQYEVKPAEGVKVSKIQNLEADLALAMKAKSVRIIAPIPGKGVVGVEIPNPEANFVMLGDILESESFKNQGLDTLPMALGNDLNGEPSIADLTKMPHILIAGATGTGKSVCLNAIITSLIFKHQQDTLDLLMVDPKMVELSAYKQLPHLRKSVVTDPTKAAKTLKWAVIEMERRYKLLSLNGVRSISEFNKRKEEGTELQGYDSEGEIVPYGLSKDEGRTLRYVVVVIDELADLMMTVKTDIEKPLITLAQKARAIGIHLIVATQRPSVNVITGLIKANFPSRIAFRVASKVDSRTILDQNGAETLLGDGDMLFLPPGANEPIRIQGAYVSTDETDKIMKWYVAQRDQGNPSMVRPEGEEDIFDEQHKYEVEEAVGANNMQSEDSDYDEFFRAAAEVCIQQDQGSTSLLQRKLKIGYGRAARIVDQLYDNGVLGPPEGSKGREVLMGMDQLDLICDELGIQ